MWRQRALDFAGSQAVLRAVADRAMQVSDEAVLTFRSHRSSRLQNASLLAAAVRLQALVAKCASGADCTDMAGLFEELLTSAAQQRFRSLLSKQAAATGRLLKHNTTPLQRLAFKPLFLSAGWQSWLLCLRCGLMLAVASRVLPWNRAPAMKH